MASVSPDVGVPDTPPIEVEEGNLEEKQEGAAGKNSTEQKECQEEEEEEGNDTKENISDEDKGDTHDDNNSSDDDSDDEPPFEWEVPDEFINKDNEFQNCKEESWSIEHIRLLYLLSMFARPALTADDEEGWMREIPLICIMYEAITAGVIDLDYAPCSMLVSHEGVSRRVWVNVTQEGKSACDDLREKGLVNGLKLSTEDFQPVTAFQVTIAHNGTYISAYIRSFS